MGEFNWMNLNRGVNSIQFKFLCSAIIYINNMKAWKLWIMKSVFKGKRKIQVETKNAYLDSHVKLREDKR